MSLFSLRKPILQSKSTDATASSVAAHARAQAESAPAHPLDAMTGGAFSAPTSGERANRVRAWLQTEPSAEAMNEVYKELVQRDRGAAKALKEKLDELRRSKAQEHIAVEWSQKAESLLAQSRLNLADAMAWQRDAARAGAPLSREPLAALKVALAERVKAIEDLQHRVQVQKESAVLTAQRIEVLSTKSWREALAQVEALRTDVAQWQGQAAQLAEDVQWPSVEPKFPPMLEAARQQLNLVWDAFSAALALAQAADADAAAPLPQVPVWAEELRAARGILAPVPEITGASAVSPERRAQAQADVQRAIEALEQELKQGKSKTAPKTASELRTLLKTHARLIGSELDTRAHALLAQAGDMEDWQRWRADQLREELVKKAEALVAAPAAERPSGRKLQETLRGLRDQWKQADQGGQSNHALWKRFDEACTLVHAEVDVWLSQLRQQAQASKAHRESLIAELRSWTDAHAGQDNWKGQVRDLHAFSERWRQAGHLNEKAFAELQPAWKEAMHAAHAGLEAAQAQSVQRRRAMIEEAQALGSGSTLRIDAVKALQQRWQAEAHAVPLERKQEQKLWDAFRGPIDEAFRRKGEERQKSAAALSAHDQSVLDAVKALEAACAQGDAQEVLRARAALDQAVRGDADASPSVGAAETSSAVGEAPAATTSVESDEAPKLAVAKKLVAVRGDDRTGVKRAETGRRDDKRGRDERPRPAAGRGEPWSDARRPLGPRLGDAAFRAQRQVLELADATLRKLSAQAHGEVLVRLMDAWRQRDASAVPSAQELGSRLNAQGRQAWVQAIGSDKAVAVPAEALLRLEMAAELPTPSEHLSARRQLQLQLLTRRHEAGPSETWARDAASVLGAVFDEASGQRLQQVLKVLLRR